MLFEWDPEKERTNKNKHGVMFGEATEVFSDILSSTAANPDHSDDENRLSYSVGLQMSDIWSSRLPSEMIEQG